MRLPSAHTTQATARATRLPTLATASAATLSPAHATTVTTSGAASIAVAITCFACTICTAAAIAITATAAATTIGTAAALILAVMECVGAGWLPLRHSRRGMRCVSTRMRMGNACGAPSPPSQASAGTRRRGLPKVAAVAHQRLGGAPTC